MGRLFVVHIGQYLIQPESGVYQKYMSIYKSLQSKVAVHLIAFTDKSKYTKDDRVQVIHVASKSKWTIIDQWLTENLNSQDVVWLRYPFASPALFQLTKKWGSQMVLEHNTDEATEALFLQRNAWKSNSISPQNIFKRSWWIYTWNTWVANATDETRWAKACIQNVKGGITVTFELEKRLHECFSDYSTLVLPNCIPQETMVECDRPMRVDDNVKIAMLIGSYDYWQGIERIIKSASAYQDNSRIIQLDVYGALPERVSNALRSASTKYFVIRQFPAIRGHQLTRTLLDYDLGIGTLSLHRKNMQEACPLKVRDYWRVGMPCLLGYTDTALLQSDKLSKWNFVIPNDESPIPWDEVVQFVERQKSISNATRMRGYREFISYESKSAELLSFLFRE